MLMVETATGNINSLKGKDFWSVDNIFKSFWLPRLSSDIWNGFGKKIYSSFKIYLENLPVFDIFSSDLIQIVSQEVAPLNNVIY